MIKKPTLSDCYKSCLNPNERPEVCTETKGGWADYPAASVHGNPVLPNFRVKLIVFID